tara:strand:- start:161 stop:913 length:753 start_codon:yes stop_codon:yes gene_type:complete
MKNVSVLEIGIDQGHSCFPIIHNLTWMCEDFKYSGIDVKLNMGVINAVDQMCNVASQRRKDNPNVNLYQANSLTILPLMVKENNKFDIIFLDGDHNYFTVCNELRHIENLCNPWTIIVCDDYHGRYAEKDLFYSERDEYSSLRVNENNIAEKLDNGNYAIDPNKATPRIQIHEDGKLKEGVKIAVNEFIVRNPGWKIRAWAKTEEMSESSSGDRYEPIVLYLGDHISVTNDSENMIQFVSKVSRERFIND